MQERIKSHLKKWEQDISKNKTWIILSMIFLVCASILNYYFGHYTNSAGTVVSPDLILNAINPINLSFLYIWLYLAVFLVILIYPLFLKPQKLSYSLGMLSLFIFIRALFTSLTPLKTPLDAIPTEFPWIFQSFQFQNDLFFSGHTGLPFLGFLMFRDNKKLSYFFLASSLILGVTVLLMHEHYSIDVFAAFFITYGVYKIGNKAQSFINNIELKITKKEIAIVNKNP